MDDGMSSQRMHNRRNFLKIAAAATAGIVFFPGRSQGLSVSSGSAGWRDDLLIHSSIDNVKTVCCFDEAMVESQLASDFAHQNEWVDPTLIAKNMDKLATMLANTDTASEAWKKIFRKPTDKLWNQVKAAIKVNCANTSNMPRVAIVSKVCTELINIGVLPANITIYDSLNNASGAGKYGDSLGTPISGLPSGIVVWTKTLDGPTVPVGSTTMQCSSAIVLPDADPITYNADILVNIGSNAGTDIAGSEPSLCMGNHIGTLKFSTPTAAELIAMNQSEAIIGQGTTAVPCRQQLCIIDSLWATVGPAGDLFKPCPCRIVMGMLPPVVDYLTAKNIREQHMNAPPNATLITSWLTAFGYTTNDVVSAWQEYSPNTNVTPANEHFEAAGTLISVSLGNASGARFTMPQKNLPVAIDVFTLNGQHVRHLSIPPRSDRSITVSLHEPGSRSGAGRYTVRCRMGGEEKIAIAKSGF
jgi:hypothetical protein